MRVKASFVFWVGIVTLSLSRLESGGGVFDHIIGIAGLVVAFGGLVVQYRYKTFPQWATDISLILGSILIGLAFAPFLPGAILESAGSPNILQTSSANTVADAQPNLKLAMLGSNIFNLNSPNPADHFVGIAIDTKIWNTGAPSVATVWQLIITPQGGIPTPAQFSAIPNQVLVGGPINSFVLRSSDSLYLKTNETTVGTIPIEGQLYFITTLPKSVVEAPSTVWQLSVQDIYGNETIAAQRQGDWLSP